jgi:hypothetical protein
VIDKLEHADERSRVLPRSSVNGFRRAMILAAAGLPCALCGLVDAQTSWAGSNYCNPCAHIARVHVRHVHGGAR